MTTLLTVVEPAIEVITKALLSCESEVITVRELRELLAKIDALVRDESRTETDRGLELMMVIRRVIDRGVSQSPLAFLKDGLSRTLGKTHEALKAFVTPRVEVTPPRRGVVDALFQRRHVRHS